MVEVFKTDKKETLYAVTGTTKDRTKILKELAAYKKENFANVKKKFRNFEAGYFIQRGNKLYLYATDEVKKGGTPCVIVRK